MLGHVLLVVLSDGNGRTGYAILKAVRARSGLDLSAGTVYRQLHRLRRLRLVERTAAALDSHFERPLYRITRRGRDAVDAWLRRRPRRFGQPGADEIDYRLAALDAMTPDRVAAFLTELHAELEASRRLLGDAEPEPDRGGTGAGLVIERRIRRMEADIAFVEALRTRLVEASGSSRDPGETDARKPTCRWPRRDQPARVACGAGPDFEDLAMRRSTG